MPCVAVCIGFRGRVGVLSPSFVLFCTVALVWTFVVSFLISFAVVVAVGVVVLACFLFLAVFGVHNGHVPIVLFFLATKDVLLTFGGRCFFG